TRVERGGHAGLRSIDGLSRRAIRLGGAIERARGSAQPKQPHGEDVGMAGQCFLSYSSVDGLEFALRLRDALEAGPPSIGLWFDKRDLQAGIDWDEQLAGAIRDAEGVLFVMTLDSVTPNSVCKKEWTRALKYKKPVIPLLVHPTAEM